MEEDHNVVLALRASAAGPSTSMAAAAPAAPAKPPASPSPPPSAAPPTPPPAAGVTSAAPEPPPRTAAAARIPAGGSERRQRLYVQLKPGETTIVSWKKLLRDADRKEKDAVRAGLGTARRGEEGAVTPPAGAHPSLENRIAPVPSVSPLDQPQPSLPPLDGEPMAGQPPHNRFNSVIEKIERLYMGNDSSDEEQPLDNVPDDDQYDTEDSFIDDAELDDYFQVDKSATKHQGFFVNKGKLEKIEPALSSGQPLKKRRRKEDAENPIEKDGAYNKRSKVLDKGMARIKAAARIAPLTGEKKTNFTNTPVHHGSQHSQDVKIMKNKSVSSAGSILKKRDLSIKPKSTGEILDAQREPTRVKALPTKVGNVADSSFKNRAKQRNGNVELPDLNYPGTGMLYPNQTTGGDVQVKEATKPKGTMLERAIRELHKVAVLYQSPHLDNQDKDTSLGTKKRLPIEVKQKLAKVARLANSQGKITSEVFFGHLMGILGHLIQPIALKRHLKEMVAMGLTAKQEKAQRFQQIKKEVAEMVKAQMVEQQAGSSDDFQDPLLGHRNVFTMNEALEDKLYHLYELHVEGMEEDKGPQSRKLYVELAELWPAGFMDRLEIKDAISRAKVRKIALYKKNKALHEEKLKRRRLSSSTSGIEDSGRISSQARTVSDRVSTATIAISDSTDIHGSKHQERPRSSGSGGANVSDQSSKAVTPMKKVNRKAEGDVDSATHDHLMKLHSLSRDRDKPSRTSESYPPKLSLHQSSSPGAQQLS